MYNPLPSPNLTSTLICVVCSRINLSRNYSHTILYNKNLPLYMFILYLSIFRIFCKKFYRYILLNIFSGFDLKITWRLIAMLFIFHFTYLLVWKFARVSRCILCFMCKTKKRKFSLYKLLIYILACVNITKLIHYFNSSVLEKFIYLFLYLEKHGFSVLLFTKGFRFFGGVCIE